MKKIQLKDIELTTTSQNLFDSFNSFVMSQDNRVFHKLVSRALFYNKVKKVPGDIVECGVFKGSGLYTFLKLKRIMNPNSSKKVIGFDFFNTERLLHNIDNENDKVAMEVLFNDRNFKHKDNFKDSLKSKILNDGFLDNEFDLVEGDVSITSKNFAESNPGFKISLLYMDLDLDKPTYDTLNNLWDNVTNGGLIVFDEYGFHKWSESKGVDRFISEKKLKIKSINSLGPTAFIRKKN